MCRIDFVVERGERGRQIIKWINVIRRGVIFSFARLLNDSERI